MEQENLVDAIREEFFKRVEEKTSWGKEKLKQLYTEAERYVVLRALFAKIGEEVPANA